MADPSRRARFAIDAVRERLRGETRQLDKIGFFVVDEDKTQVTLIIADHLDWEEFDDGPHLELLQDRINAYLHFVDGRQLIETRLEGVLVVI